MGKVLLYLFLGIIALSLFINYPFFFLGLALVIWAIYEWRVNRQLRAKSRKPLLIITFGLLMSLVSCSVTMSNYAKEQEKIKVAEAKKAKENARLAKIKAEEEAKQAKIRAAEEARLAKIEAEQERVRKIEEAKQLAIQKAQAAKLAKIKAEQARVARIKKAEADRKARIAAAQAAKKEAARQAQYDREHSVFYSNCTEVRNAGADPIYEGEPGYATHLDRDGDGIACDR